MVYLSYFTDTLPITLNEAAEAWQLSFGRLRAGAPLLHLRFVPVIVLHRGNRGFLRDMKVIVEVSAVRADPRERPTHAFFERDELLNGCAGHADERYVTRVEVLERVEGVPD